jgi:hypothetical protein
LSEVPFQSWNRPANKRLAEMLKLTIGLWVFVRPWTSASVAQPDNLDDKSTRRGRNREIKEPYPNRWWQNNLLGGAKRNAARRFF